MSTTYHTTRQTTVHTRRIGSAEKPGQHPKTPKTPKPKFEIIDSDPRSPVVFVDGLLPRDLANKLARICHALAE